MGTVWAAGYMFAVGYLQPSTAGSIWMILFWPLKLGESLRAKQAGEGDK